MSPVKRGKKTKESVRKGHVRKAGRRRKKLRGLDLEMRQWVRWFSLASVLLLAMGAFAGYLVIKHYREYPVVVDRDSITVVERGADHISISWDESHNTDIYKIFVKKLDPDADEDEQLETGDLVEIDDSWRELESETASIDVDGLEENAIYSFVIRGDNAEHEGKHTAVRNFRTKRTQEIEVDKKITKLTSSKNFRLNAVAETDLEFESSDPEIAEVLPDTGEIQINGAGTVNITVRAKATKNFEADETVVEMEVIEAEPVKAGGASAHIIYRLSSSNCEIVKKITGSGGAVVPQGLAYTGDKYIVSYGMGSPDRIVSFDVDGDGKDVSVPKVSLGHPNGFTYADENGLCYCVKGWSSRAVTYEPTSGSYGTVKLPYGCSGIGYDRREKLLYTCSRTAMVAYDISDGYTVVNRCGVVKHSGTTYTQDCGGYAGIMMRCLSGSKKHGTNYIDLYDMKNGMYLGTIACDLSEVESVIVDNDGFLEILSNNTSKVDYIWKTGLNIETIGEGLE